MRVLVSGNESGLVCPATATLFDDGLFLKGAFE
jgi:hypothetical protein